MCRYLFTKPHTRIHTHLHSGTHSHNTIWLIVYRRILRINQFLASRMITLKPSVFYGFNKSTEKSTVTYVIHVQYWMQQAVQHKTFSFKSKRIAKNFKLKFYFIFTITFIIINTNNIILLSLLLSLSLSLLLLLLLFLSQTFQLTRLSNQFV